MSLSTTFKAIGQKDFEKHEILMDKPLIRFSPDVSRLQKATKHSIELKVNPADAADLQTYKYPYLILETGTVEDLLLWKNQVEEVINKKPIKTPEAKFSMVRVMLGGDARDRWDTIVERETKRTSTTANGVVVAAKGETQETFELSTAIFKRLWFRPTSRALTIQRDYLQHNVRFPTKAGLPLEEFFNRVLNINSKLNSFPTPIGYSGNKFFSDEELKLLILRALPQYCTLQVHKSGRGIDQFTLDSLREFLDVCLTEKNRPEKGKEKKEDPKKGNNKGKRKASVNEEGGARPKKRTRFFCSHCKSKGRSPKVYTSHNSDKCKFLKAKQEGKGDRALKKAYALIKAQSKRLKKFENNGDDESDSDVSA